MTEALDLFLRSAAIGQVLLIGAVHLRIPTGRRELSLLAVGLCLAAQLLLTSTLAPSGALRNLLLVLTDASAYAIWFAALTAIDDRFAATRWPLPAKIGLAVLGMWHLYFFGMRGGVGPYHQINHVIAVILLSHVVFVALQGWRDDLVDTRRRTRLLLALAISVYGIALAAGQLVLKGWRGDVFALTNAALCFAGTLVFGRYVLLRPAPAEDAPAPAPLEVPPATDVPPELRALNQRLDTFIAQRGYTQANLTIAQLAASLGCPEHRLRRLINRGLGYRNFSDFLNRHRVADACRQLSDPDLDVPVLTLALDLGYGSIGPFNRAFRAQTGMTPTEFRDTRRNRP